MAVRSRWTARSARQALSGNRDHMDRLLTCLPTLCLYRHELRFPEAHSRRHPGTDPDSFGKRFISSPFGLTAPHPRFPGVLRAFPMQCAPLAGTPGCRFTSAQLWLTPSERSQLPASNTWRRLLTARNKPPSLCRSITVLRQGSLLAFPCAATPGTQCSAFHIPVGSGPLPPHAMSVDCPCNLPCFIHGLETLRRDHFAGSAIAPLRSPLRAMSL